MKKIRTTARWALLATITTVSAVGLAQPRTLWQIGKFDASSGEFERQNIDYANPKSDPVYVVGTSNDKDWHGFQPGPANGMTGARLHPYTIRFSLNDEPRGVYSLKIAMLYETPRLSSLDLSVNGHTGRFYFHPRLNFDAGDWEGTYVPQTSADEKSIAIPAAWLRRGENELVLTAIDEPATPQTSLGSIAPGNTGLAYDAIAFSQDAAEHNQPHALTARIEPTIFFKNGPNGLEEVVDVFVSGARAKQAATLTLTLAGRAFQTRIRRDVDFGESHAAFDVPVWTGSVSATVRVEGQSSSPANIECAKRWTIAIIPHEHLDIGFTDYPAKVAELHSQSIDAAMGLMQAHPEFRWTLDGSWVADQYLNGRSPEAREQFLDKVREGSIVIPPEFANQHTGNASWEGMARSFYERNQLAAKYNLPANDAAQIVDVPAYPWSYASVLHDAGIKYFIAASNGWRAPVTLLGRWNEKSPFYWEGPDGGRVLMWYSRAYLQMHTLFGGPWQIEAIRDALPVFLQAYTRPDYTANTAIIFGTQLENTPLALAQSEIVSTFERQYAWPRLEFATVHSAMQQIEQQWKGEIPVIRGDFGPYWEDGYGSDAAHTSIHRENQHRIVTAEILGAAVSSVDTRVRPDSPLLNDAWNNELLYDEHTWTYAGSTTQPEHHLSQEMIALKRARVVRAHDDINESIERGWARLEALIRPKENSIAVFNSLNWTRSGLVETDIPAGSGLVDSDTGAAIPFEVLSTSHGIPLPGSGGDSQRIRFAATNVPAVGYKLFAVRSSSDRQPKATEATPGNILENSYYRISLDPASGAIASIYDKQLGKELVDTSSAYRFGSYLYVTGADTYPDNSLFRFGAGLKPPSLTVHPATSGRLVSIRQTAIGSEATLASSSENTPSIETDIVLPTNEKTILLTYRLHKDPVLTREAAYIAFPFAVSHSEFTYGSQSGWVNPAKDELAGGSREWYVPTTWSAVHNSAVTAAVVPLDAPLVNFGDIVRGNWPVDFKPASSTIFSWLMNNYWATNFPATQGGDFTFRYAITSSAQFEPPALTHFAWNVLTPLEHDDVGASTDSSPLPPNQSGLIDISADNVTLLTWKSAEDGDGSILRLQESAGQEATVAIRSKYLTFEHAWMCNAIEQNQKDLATDSGNLSIAIRPFQVLTVRLRTKSRGFQGATP